MPAEAGGVRICVVIYWASDQSLMRPVELMMDEIGGHKHAAGKFQGSAEMAAVKTGYDDPCIGMDAIGQWW